MVTAVEETWPVNIFQAAVMFLSKHMCWNPPEAYKHHFFRGQGCRCSCCRNIQRGYKSQRCCWFFVGFLFSPRQNCPLGLALNLWPCGDACRLSQCCHLSVRAWHKAPSPSMSFIESTDVPRRQRFCDGNSFIRRKRSPPKRCLQRGTWDQRLRPHAATPISPTDRDGWHRRPPTS